MNLTILKCCMKISCLISKNKMKMKLQWKLELFNRRQSSSTNFVEMVQYAFESGHTNFRSVCLCVCQLVRKSERKKIRNTVCINFCQSLVIGTAFRAIDTQTVPGAYTVCACIEHRFLLNSLLKLNYFSVQYLNFLLIIINAINI